MPIRSRSALAKAFPKREHWQTEALDYFDSAPELKYTGLWVGNAMSKVKLYVAVEGPDGEPIAVDAKDADGKSLSNVPDAVVAQALAELNRLKLGAPSGIGGLLRSFSVNIDHAGECWLVGTGKREAVPADPERRIEARPEQPETWDVYSIKAVEKKGDAVVVKRTANDNGTKLDPELDTCIRLWQRHETGYPHDADSNVRGVLGELRLAGVLSGQMLAESMSRHNAGLLIVQSNATWGGKSAADPDGQDGQDAEDPFMAGLTEAITSPVEDPTDPSSVVPNLVRAEDVEKAVKRVDLSREQGDQLDRRLDKRIERIAGGLNVPKEVVLGHRSTTFSNASQIADDEFTDHLEPRCLLAVDCLTGYFLRPQLLEAGGESAAWANRLFFWYDASALLDPPDPSEAADEALRNYAISWRAYRAAKGFTEDDAPTLEERREMLAHFRGIFTADLSLALLNAGSGDPLEVVPIPPAVDPNKDPSAPTTTDGEATAQVAALVAAVGGPRIAMAMLHQALGLRPPDRDRPAPIELTAGGPGPNPQ